MITGYDKTLTEKDKRLPFYIATIGEMMSQNVVYRPAGIPDYQLLYTYSGTGTVKIKDSEHILAEGDILILPPFAPHDYRPLLESWRVAYITYNGLAVEECFGFSADIRRISRVEFIKHYKSILSWKYGTDFCHNSSPLLYSLLLSLSLTKSSLGTAVGLSPVGIKAAIAYVSEHYTETVELSRLAALAGMSEGHFCRRFKEHTRQRPIEYINRIRIEDAKNRLITRRDETVSSIAYALGFESPVYFAKVFKASVGKTPTEYRESAKDEIY